MSGRRLCGIFTPTMVPLDAQGEINEGELRRHIDWLIAKGVNGLYPNGSTGEFTRFSVDERRRIVRITCQQAAGRVPVLAGAAEANVRETLKSCEQYAEYGARAVAVVSPFYYRLGPESVFAYFREIALSSPIDVTLYNIPMFASPIDLATVQRLAEFDRIIGIKDSSGDLAFMTRMISQIRPHRTDFMFLTGWEAVLAAMLVMGADGAISASSGVVPEITGGIYRHVTSGDLVKARDLQAELIELFDLMLHSLDFPLGFRAAVSLRGFAMGESRQPMSDELRKQYQDLLPKLADRLKRLSIDDA
ncbi:MAG TPA: dihydrodipicolinate synthase family protein [Lacipirellulaceae bacterium]|nr:dihydrodipicolinate synthase family protein [Lacipirellulaceae bacterium]HMP04868.1 dihydrodipicolinate synthase family protein [Lacipirellulaceae bacterium]